MRPFTAFPAGIIASVLVLVACSSDQQAPTAPITRPSFKQFSVDRTYRFSFTCSANAEPTTSRADMNVYHSDPPDVGNATGLDLLCGAAATDLTTVYSFDYDIAVRDATAGGIDAHCQTQHNGVSYTVNRTGTFTCKSKTVSGTLTVTQVGA
jgi:hypothetical protein